MLSTIILSFFSGCWFFNGFPHFVKGITRERYPTLFGNSPVINFIVGWAVIVTAPFLLHWAHPERHPVQAIVAGATGALLIGLFHAGPGAFGKKENKSALAKNNQTGD